MQPLFQNIFLFEDTCNVYVVRSGDSAVLIDFGSGDVLDHLSEIGVTGVTAVLMTHHHRDQGQGLPRAVAAGIPIWVPHMEQDLFAEADNHWQAREIYVNYNSRQDRFSLLASVPIAGTLLDYDTPSFGGYEFLIVPTPGHTTGSITLMSTIDGLRAAFSGDLISAPGQVWSMAATQWTYNGAEGVAAGTASLLDLKDRQPQVLLPSHGAPMHNPIEAIDQLVARFWALLQLRGHNLRLFELRDHPYEAVSPHLLWHRASLANTYVLLSQSKKALIFDFGYDFITGMINGFDRAARRPWLYTIPALKRDFGVAHIDVVLPTHFHDDHVAGMNLLRRVEGAQVWAPDFFADVLEQPAQYDLPCLWYDPIPVDKRLPLETAVQWEEYTLTLYALPGHTFYAVAIAVEVDGQRILVTGDQYQGEDGLEFNYVYPNRYIANDYAKSAALYRRVNPDIILTGHWAPLHVPPDYFDKLDVMGSELTRLHEDLLGPAFARGVEDFFARLTPYHASAKLGETLTVQAEIRNPSRGPVEGTAEIIVPQGWQIMGDAKAALHFETPTTTVTFQLVPQGEPARRARIAVDIVLDGRRYGQQAEALITTV